MCFEGFEKYSCYLKSFFHLKKIYTFYKNISLLGFFLESWSDSIGTAIIKPKIQIFLNNFLCIEGLKFFWIWQIYIILWCIYIYQIYFNATLYYNKKSFLQQRSLSCYNLLQASAKFILLIQPIQNCMHNNNNNNYNNNNNDNNKYYKSIGNKCS